jgi:hypothetical protein
VADSYTEVNEFSESINGEDFRDQLTNYQLLNKIHVLVLFE